MRPLLFLQNGDREKEKNCGRWKENKMFSKWKKKSLHAGGQSVGYPVNITVSWDVMEHAVT
jgi:hypothetical protein